MAHDVKEVFKSIEDWEKLLVEMRDWLVEAPWKDADEELDTMNEWAARAAQICCVLELGE